MLCLGLKQIHRVLQRPCCSLPAVDPPSWLPCRILDSFSSVDIPEIPANSETTVVCTPQPESRPSSTLPVYVMLPLDTVWLLEREEKAVCTPYCQTISMLAPWPVFSDAVTCCLACYALAEYFYRSDCSLNMSSLVDYSKLAPVWREEHGIAFWREDKHGIEWECMMCRCQSSNGRRPWKWACKR